MTDTLVIREAHSADKGELERLAALDSREFVAGDYVVAEVDGSLVAATPLKRGSRSFSDPFKPTAGILEVLGVWARQLRTTGAA